MIFFHPGKNSMLTRPIFHTTWQWTHSGKHLRMCEIVCWWRKCRMCKNRIVEEQKHWRIRHKKEDSAKYNKTRVGDKYDRWTELKDVLRIKTSSSSYFCSYHMLLGKLWNCSRFIINHVMLMAIPPNDNTKHSNSFH